MPENRGRIDVDGHDGWGYPVRKCPAINFILGYKLIVMNCLKSNAE